MANLQIDSKKEFLIVFIISVISSVSEKVSTFIS